MEEAQGWLAIIDFGRTLDEMPKNKLPVFLRTLKENGFEPLIATSGSVVYPGMFLDDVDECGRDGALRPKIKAKADKLSNKGWLAIAGDTPASCCVVIDDEKRYIGAAQKVGMHTILFNPNTPLEELAETICKIQRGNGVVLTASVATLDR